MFDKILTGSPKTILAVLLVLIGSVVIGLQVGGQGSVNNLAAALGSSASGIAEYDILIDLPEHLGGPVKPTGPEKFFTGRPIRVLKKTGPFINRGEVSLHSTD